MADNTVSQASTSSGNVKRKPSSQDTPAKAKAKVKRTSKADDKQADSRHRLLEQQLSKALFEQELRLQVQDSIPAAKPRPSSVSCGSQGEVTTVVPPPIPSASFAPTAAGLQGPEHPSYTAQLQAMISQAVTQAMAASGRAIPVQGPSNLPMPTETMHPRECVISDHGSPPQSEGSKISDYSAQIPEGGMWSDGEDIQVEATPMVGVFNPNSFYSLLQKAYVTGKIEPVKPQTADQDSGQSSDTLFLEPVKKNLQIPCPPMFLKSIQDQWGSPGRFSALGRLDRKLLDTVPSLNDVLEVPGVDEALAPILSDTKIPGDMSEVLKAEDKKSEISLKRTIMHRLGL